MPHSEQEARKILEPYMEAFGRIWPMAWDRWEQFGKSSPDLRLLVCPRTRASMLSNFGTKAAEEIFADMSPHVILTDQPGFLLMLVESELHVRLKKYRDRSYRTCGVPTTQREMFEAQQPTITNFPEASNCVHGYVLKKDASGYAETAIKCSTGKVLHWSIDVPLVEAGKVQELPTRTAGVVEPGISSTLTGDEHAEEGGISG